ncbi:Rad52/Rad22 family DNA repair protein [Gehongia tenuis]|uniref:Recombinase n=1 Tax=Gehongia tenuis TaxID=2763655 RepID=A0A926D6B7_9FIRM|nr:Rad52/Rad22 family DNA repair protein [Gehongia tenuis]MBC8532152.1 recombinase [Gehongia tenuis]
MDAATIKARLQAPFAPDELEWRVGATSGDKSKGMALAYVTNRAIQNRLDDVFGPFGWRNEYQQWQGKSQLCGISVYDAEKGEWVTKWDGADNTEFESTKGGLSDAMKRAAYQWGIGRYLYKLDAKWVPIKPVGNKSYTLAGPPPALPAWALPEGYKSQPRQRQEPPKCEECGSHIRPTSKSTVEELIQYGREHYAAQLCVECMKKRLEASKSESA